MIKKILKNMIFLMMIGFALGAPIAHGNAHNNWRSSGLFALNPNDFFAPFSYEKRSTENTKIGYVKDLPKGTIIDVLITIVRFLLGITGALTLISFTYAGIMFVTAQGDETHLTKAKKMMALSILGLAIIATSYAIVLGISQLKF